MGIVAGVQITLGCGNTCGAVEGYMRALMFTTEARRADQAHILTRKSTGNGFGHDNSLFQSTHDFSPHLDKSIIKSCQPFKNNQALNCDTPEIENKPYINFD
jgi:hypothetical protein